MRYETYAADAWDISPLAGIGLTGYWPYPQLQKGTSGGCENTVALAGKCYHAGAVNYAMWGKVNSLCHGTFGINPLHTLTGSQALVFVWKSVYLWAQVGEATAFTSYGYTGGGDPNCNLPNCVVSGTSPVGNFSFTWNRVPNP